VCVARGCREVDGATGYTLHDLHRSYPPTLLPVSNFWKMTCVPLDEQCVRKAIMYELLNQLC
jgi:hypothetical protein